MSLKVQSDDLGNVVRVLVATDDGMTHVELEPDRADDLASMLTDAAEEVRTPESDFAGVVDEDQSRLTEVDADHDDQITIDQPITESDDDPPDLGEMWNESNPENW